MSSTRTTTTTTTTTTTITNPHSLAWRCRSPTRRRRRRQPRERRLYFAYGSNLCLEQMARRCPSSYLFGHGVLPDHKWQINERGFASVVPCAGYAVHGLVYELNGDADDEGEEEEKARRLDRIQGVHSGAYAKATRDVVLYEAAPALRLRTQTYVRTGGAALTLAAVHRRNGGASAASLLAERPPRLQRDVLVYMSEAILTPGASRDEHIDHMNRGISDALVLGIPDEFFHNTVRPYIPDRAPRRNILSTAAAVIRRARSQSRPERVGGSGGGKERASSVSAEAVDPRDVGQRRQSVDYQPLSWNASPVEYIRYVGDSRVRIIGHEEYGRWEPVVGYPRRSRSTRRV
ncbi:hypothetical protein C7999DRAFT_10105 [Corynascus novoguineensis]|uniref:gamma-glutamylcyclotransferase n=1 Tax=Corynascus novoguineensis TaxID=1126955 RepID=A0AAN7D5U1_9PEZI|nr:hypothetical protein C7999DRAFT_10105 [Corynascus novoguineensis]